MFEDLNVKNYKIYEFEKAAKGSTYNNLDNEIRENYKSIFRDQLRKKADKILFFEDDAQIIENVNLDNIENCVSFMNEQKWDVIYLGHIPGMHLVQTKYKHIVKTYRPFCTHAVCLSKKAMIHLLQNAHEGTMIDVFASKTLPNKYALYPSLFTQNKNPKYMEQFKIAKNIKFENVQVVLEKILYVPNFIALLIIVFAINKKVGLGFLLIYILYIIYTRPKSGIPFSNQIAIK
jgi:hypothetical protein